MSAYRMHVDGTICFTIHADSEAEAVRKAEHIKAVHVSGLDIDAGDDSLDLRAYFDDDASPRVGDQDEG